MLTLTLTKTPVCLSLHFDGDLEEVNEMSRCLCCLGDRYTRHNWEPVTGDPRVVTLTPKYPNSACPQVDMMLLNRFLVKNQRGDGVDDYQFINLVESV